MSTRGFVGFVIDGTEKIAYNHFDSYPGGLGVDVLGWLRGAEPLLPRLKNAARALRVVDPASTPSAEDIDRLREFADLGVGTQSVDDWYVLLRKTQGSPGLMLDAGYIEDAGTFPTDSLFAEWGYIVDLDADVFETYEGFQGAAHDKGRFAGRPPGSQGYYPCALAGSWPLTELPTDAQFIAALDKEGDEG